MDVDLHFGALFYGQVKSIKILVEMKPWFCGSVQIMQFYDVLGWSLSESLWPWFCFNNKTHRHKPSLQYSEYTSHTLDIISVYTH